MYPETDTRLPPILRQLPFIVLELDGDGTVRSTNGRLDALLAVALRGQPLRDHLDPLSAGKLRRLLAELEEDSQARSVWELNVRTPGGLQARKFYAFREEPDRAVWLIERQDEGGLGGLGAQLSSLGAEIEATQRELSKKSTRLARALDEVERKLVENDALSRELQSRNEEVAAQHEDLLAITSQLHRGQEELLQLNQQLEVRTRELQSALSGRSRFYASMSHELRTPVNAVMGYNDLLLAGIYGELNEQQELAVERSQRAVRHLRELINDVLDLSRIEGGRTELEIALVELTPFLEGIVEEVEPLARRARTAVHLARPDVPQTIETDARRLRQILVSLLTHAIVNGEDKPVWIRCERAARGGVTIEVIDNGKGVPTEDLTTIFDEFAQGGVSESLTTGLELTLARRLARLLGGKLEASSTEGVGTTFRLCLPRAPSAGAPDR